MDPTHGFIFWINAMFSTSKAYNTLIGQRSTPRALHQIWSLRCQIKHKVFFQLLVKDRLSTIDLLRRKHMILESYSCELCLQQRLETVSHLVLRCNFTEACWNSIWIFVFTSRLLLHIINLIKQKLQVPFFMEVIMHSDDMEYLAYKKRVDV